MKKQVVEKYRDLREKLWAISEQQTVEIMDAINKADNEREKVIEGFLKEASDAPVA